MGKVRPYSPPVSACETRRPCRWRWPTCLPPTAGEDRYLAGKTPVLVRGVRDGRNLFPTPGGLEVWRQPRMRTRTNEFRKNANHVTDSLENPNETEPLRGHHGPESVCVFASRLTHLQNAPAGILRDAVAAGATGFTHLGNGCPQQLDRHDNIVWRVLDTPGLVVGLIADGIHVSPPLFRLLHRVLPADRIYHTTDAMAATGSPPGEFTLGRLRLHVGADGVVRQPGRPNFAGSSAQPGQLATRASAMLARLSQLD